MPWPVSEPISLSANGLHKFQHPLSPPEVGRVGNWVTKYFLSHQVLRKCGPTYPSQDLIKWWLALFGLVVQDQMCVLILHSESSQEF